MKMTTLFKLVTGMVLLFMIHSCKEDEGFHQITPIEQQIHKNINDYRKENGMEPLVFQFPLFVEARAYSLRMINGVVQPEEGLDVIFNELKSKFGSVDDGAIIELTNLNNAVNIVDLFKTDDYHDSIMLGKFTQAGVGFASKDIGINYVTVLFLDIP